MTNVIIDDKSGGRLNFERRGMTGRVMLSRTLRHIVALWSLILCGAVAGGCASQVAYDRANPSAVREVLAHQGDTANAAWWGFNEENATESLQAAIRSGAKKVVVPNMGKPWIVEPIQLESNQEIIFEKGVVVAARKGKFQGTNDSLFSAWDKENITLRGYGAQFVMRKADYRKAPYKKAEWRMCLALRGCKNVKVYGLRLASSGGDGIYIGRGKTRTYCEDIQIKDVLCDDNYRQGISVITVRNLLIENCTLRGTEGTAPAAGIDLEPNHSDEQVVNCIIRNCLIENNAGSGLLIVLGHLGAESEPVSILVENCRVLDNRNAALRVTNTQVPGRIELRGNELSGKLRVRDLPALEVVIRQ